MTYLKIKNLPHIVSDNPLLGTPDLFDSKTEPRILVELYTQPAFHSLRRRSDASIAPLTGDDVRDAIVEAEDDSFLKTGAGRKFLSADLDAMRLLAASLDSVVKANDSP